MLRELHHFPGGNNVVQEDVWQDNVVCDAGVSLLPGVATPAHAGRDDKCRRDIRKAEETLEKAVRKHSEGSRQAEQRSRRQQFVVQSRRGGNTVAVSRLHDCVVGVPVGSRRRHLLIPTQELRAALPPDAVDRGLPVQANRAVRPDPLVRNDLVRTTPLSLS